MAASQASNNYNNRLRGAVPAASTNSIRRVVTDRSDLAPTSQGITSVRNIRTSSMPNKAASQATTGRETTDEQFNAAYAKKGIQPHSILADKELLGQTLKAAQVENEKIAMQEAAEEASYNEHIAAQAAEQAFMENQMRQAFEEEQSEAALAEGQAANQANQTATLARKLRNKKITLAKNTLGRVKATTVNSGIWAWGIPAWLLFQLPFALLSLVFLMTSALIDEITKAIYAPPDTSDGWLVSTLKTLVGTVGDFVSWMMDGVGKLFEGIFGFDPTGISFDGIFVGLWLIVIAFGVFMLIAMYLIYKLAFLNPLSGSGAGAKMGAFLLALVGYSVPILNLFPWFIVWTFAVWRYPK